MEEDAEELFQEELLKNITTVQVAQKNIKFVQKRESEKRCAEY